MEIISTILRQKQPHFKKISPDCSLHEALGRMISNQTDYLIVMDNENRFLGLLTEHDISSKFALQSASGKNFLVRELMSTQWPIADSRQTLEDCIRLMQQHRVRHLPVFDEYEFAGVVSSEDILHEAVYHRFGIFDEDRKEKPYSVAY